MQNASRVLILQTTITELDPTAKVKKITKSPRDTHIQHSHHNCERITLSQNFLIVAAINLV